MSELTPLDKAEAAVRDATANTDIVRIVAAVLATQQATQQQPHQCEHHTPQQQFDAKKWWTIGGLAIVGGCVACALALAFALAATAIATCATCATACLIVLRSMWRDYAKGK